ncbi:hypothetical protein BGX38DRAFT_922027 [Terfezia claveryi]|nr:hypothetical protein BGX38DRAFT_922027 [Terfezia claveryi]
MSTYMSPHLSPLGIPSGSHTHRNILILDSSLDAFPISPVDEKYNSGSNCLSNLDLLNGVQNIMRNSSITAYSSVGTDCSSIELTAFKGIQSSNNFSFGTAPFNPPSTWAGWGLNVAPNLHPITPPISVHPDRCTFFRQAYDARLAEGGLEASTYNVG